ncbi:hypothetical protein ACFQV2_31605 [Actinokineospora soli]|uniref:Cas10/Cmr2 second palm domain-containing protein n=1 Tax=Actinokineospora soli TaxID=1048753 RepID=A0ABW2TUY7_9PSEU
MSARFLDVAVVGVQSWLTRTSNLQGRRGASTLIREATDPARVMADIPGLGEIAAVNTDAGQVDGVVALRLLADGDADAERAEWAVAEHLRARLPAASLRAVHLRGDSYAAARAADTVLAQREWVPMVPEWPAGKPCDWCRTWTASQMVKTADEHIGLCRDCLARRVAAGSTVSTRAGRAPGTERDLLARLDTAARVPNDFTELAELGPPGEHTRGHPARRRQRHRPLRHRRPHPLPGFPVAATISEATWSALLAAIAAITPAHATVLPMVAHFVGGDDVLVSVPAHQVWRFLAALLPAFAEHTTTDRRLRKVTAPTLSAGVVVHHRAEPLSTVADLAWRLLTAAKQDHRGQHAAIGWQSVTHDGTDRITRPSLPVADLAARWPDLARLAALPGSARARLGELCLAERRGAAPHRLDAHAERLGIGETTAPFRGHGGIALDDALALTRWWT